MADSDKDIHIHPRRGHSAQPRIDFTGFDNITTSLYVLDDGTLSFESSAGQLFSVSPAMSGTIFSVNDVSGIPSIEVEDDGTITLGEFAGNVVIGAANTSYTNTDNTPVISGLSDTKVFVDGSIYLTGSNDALFLGRSTGSFLKDEELAFGWGGGWYMTDGTYIRARNNKAIYTTGYVYGARFYDANDGTYYVDPAGTSNLGTAARANEFYARNWFRNDNSGEGLYNQSTGQHWYSDDDDYWNIAGGTSANGIRFRDEHAGTIRGYVYADSSNQVGFLDAGGSWAVKHVNDSGTYFYTDGGTEELRVGRDVVSGNYGTVETKTTRSSWGGYSINGRVVFMHDHSNAWGIYNDVNNEWMVYGTLNGYVQLRYDNSTKLQTSSTGVTVTGTLTADGLTVGGSPVTAGASPQMYIFYVDEDGDFHYEAPTGSESYSEGSSTYTHYTMVPGASGITYSINSSGDFIASY